MAYWNPTTRRTALEWFASREGTDVFFNVPVSRSDWRDWPEGAGEHRVDGVALNSGRGQLLEWQDGQADAFVEACAPGLRLVLAWGSVDRPALGMVATGTRMFSRSFPGHGQIGEVALVPPSQASSNAAPIFTARGVEIVVVPDEVFS